MADLEYNGRPFSDIDNFAAAVKKLGSKKAKLYKELRTRYQELDPRKPTIVICSAGNRSSLAASILEQHGFQEIYSVAGGMRGYSVAGYAKHCAVCENPHGSRYESTYILVESS